MVLSVLLFWFSLTLHINFNSVLFYVLVLFLNTRYLYDFVL